MKCRGHHSSAVSKFYLSADTALRLQFTTHTQAMAKYQDVDKLYKEM